MRTLRTLVAAGLAVPLLAIPALSAAQSDSAEIATPRPHALMPAGRLPLEGTPWRLEAYVHGDGAGVPGPEVAAFLEFSAGSYVGSGGCSKVAGSYGLSGSAVTLRPKQLDGRKCTEDLADVQQAVEAGLRKGAAYQIEPGATTGEDQLVIHSVTGSEVLRYGLDDLTPLDAAEWRLQSYTAAGQPVDASTEMPGLISFRPESDAFYKRRMSGPISGTTGCNGFVAEFDRRSDVLGFDQLEITDAPCTPELAAQEVAMMAVLDAAELSLELPADQLTLTSADSGERLEFVSQTPLEGTTWWLGRTAAQGGIDDQRLTLRLENGVATGDGPCGSYSASYVTEGVFITFTDAKGARDEDCSELRTEQALIGGLRRAVRVERKLDGLEFRDALGNAQLTFGRPFAP